MYNPLLKFLLFTALSAGAVGGAAAQEKKLFRWGGDKAGGAPYIFTDADEKQVGFETEFADYLAAKLGREPKFVNGDWAELTDILARGTDIDVALNGMEYLPDRAKQATIPYFLYTLRLIVRKNEERIKGWEDLKPDASGRKLRVGVLLGTVAQQWMNRKFKDSIEIIPLKEVEEAFQMVEDGSRLDATVQDSPAAIHYVQNGERDKLKIVGEPRGRNFYVILTQEKDRELRDQLNVAIKEAILDGYMEGLLRKYKIWNADQERLTYTLLRPWPPAVLDEEVEAESGDEEAKRRSIFALQMPILSALGYTAGLAFAAMPLAIIIGIAVAIGRIYGPRFVRIPLTIYVEVIRGTPLLLQVYVLFYLVPELAKFTGCETLVDLVTWRPFYVGVLGLAINYSAYEAEIYRAGIQAIPKGQMEASLSLGMTRWQSVRHVILPQAVRIVIPPVTNDFVNMFKDTSICSMILITELTGLYYQNKSDRYLAYLLAGVIAVLYMLLSYPVSHLARRLENRMRRSLA